MFSLKTKVKILAVIFAIYSGILVTSVCPVCNEVTIYMFGLKYPNLQRAIQSLFTFQYNEKTEESFAYVQKNVDWGFNDLLNIIRERRAIKSDINNVTVIFLVKTGTGIRIGGLDATPQYLLVVRENTKDEAVAVMYENDLLSWIEDEKKDDLQLASFLFLLVAVLLEFSTDISYEDFTKIKERVTVYLVSINERYRQAVKKSQSSPK